MLYPLFWIFQHCQVCLNTYHAYELDFQELLFRNLSPAPITKWEIPNPAKTTQSNSKQKTHHIDRENFATSCQSKASHRSSDSRITGLFFSKSFGYSPKDMILQQAIFFSVIQKHHVGGNHNNYNHVEDIKTTWPLVNWSRRRVFMKRVFKIKL